MATVYEDALEEVREDEYRKAKNRIKYEIEEIIRNQGVIRTANKAIELSKKLIKEITVEEVNI